MPTNARSFVVLLAACAAIALAACDESEPKATAEDAPAADSRKDDAQTGHRALLVGCSEYEHPGLPDLPGAASDVELMRRLLVERFRFPRDGVTVLTDGGELERRPVRANIRREFGCLAEAAKPGDRIVVYLSGHGSWQPDDDPENPDDLEEDGRDEVFLPVDARRLSHEDRRVENGILDDELRAWLKAIADGGADVWFVVDSCHSGTIARAGSDERIRGISPESLLPEAEREKEGELGVVSRGDGEEAVAFERPPGESPGRLTMTYAAQPHEETFEARLPKGSPKAKPHGIFTFTLCQTLNNSTGVTYRELVQRIHARYQHQGRYGPTPVAEGASLDTEVLGDESHAGRSRIALRKSGRQWKINAGALHEIGANTVLAVFPPAGTDHDDRPLGHVRVTQRDLLGSVVEPCAFADLPAVDQFPKENRCEVVHVDYGLRRMKLAADSHDDAGEPLPEAELQSLREELATAGRRLESLVEFVDDPLAANWLLRLRDGDAFLVSAANVPGQPDSDPRRFRIPRERPGDIADWLEIQAPRIVRAENLIRLASSPQDERFRGRRAVQVDVEMLKYTGPSGREGKVVPWDSDLTFTEGDHVGFRITNNSRMLIDACLLFVDSRHGIMQFYPAPGQFNRLKPFDSFITEGGTINAETVGLERLVLIAVKARPQTEPVELSFLQQEPIGAGQRGGEDDVPRNWRQWEFPLASLLVHCKDPRQGTRGLRMLDLEEHSVKLFSWRTKAKEPGS